jgi:hypothetical protein
MCRRVDDTECERPQGAPLAQSRRLVWTLCPVILFTEVRPADVSRANVRAPCVQSGPSSWQASAGIYSLFSLLTS